MTDLTFFTNEQGSTLLDRFIKILDQVKYFDILVGYFRTSGFFKLYESFESIEKIRILVGLNVDRKTYEIIVDKILAITKDEDYPQNKQKQSQVAELEKEIDRMVYELYDLTPEEIAIVERNL